MNGAVSFDTIDLRHQRNPDVVLCPYCENIGKKDMNYGNR